MLKFSIRVVLSRSMMDAYMYVVFVGSIEVDNFMGLLSKKIFRDEHSRLVVYALAENLVRCILMLFKIFFD